MCLQDKAVAQLLTKPSQMKPCKFFSLHTMVAVSRHQATWHINKLQAVRSDSEADMTHPAQCDHEHDKVLPNKRMWEGRRFAANRVTQLLDHS
jgi:hypothetical protein